MAGVRRWMRGPAALAVVALVATGCAAIQRVDQGTGGGAGDQTGTPVALSGDGRYVLVESLASNLVAGDTNGAGDLFRRDTETGTTVRASLKDDDTQISGTSTLGAMDASGRRVAFATTVSLADADTNGVRDVYVRDLQDGTTTLASLAPDGSQAAGSTQGANTGGISGDGRYVAFTVTDQLHATGGKTYIRDLQNGTSVEVAAGDATFARFSGDGQHLAVSQYCGPNRCQAPAPVFVDLGGPSLATRTFCPGTRVAAISRDGSVVALNGPSAVVAGCQVVETATRWNRTTDTVSALIVPPSPSVIVTSIDADGRLFAMEDHRDVDTRAVVLDATPNSITGLASPNRDQIGQPGNEISMVPVLSGDGTRVAFATASTNLVSDPPGNSLVHVYVTAALRPQVATFAASGTRGTTVPLAFDGVSLRPGATVLVSGVGLAGATTTNTAWTHLSTMIAVPADAATGPHDVWVVVPGTTALCSGCFSVT